MGSVVGSFSEIGAFPKKGAAMIVRSTRATRRVAFTLMEVLVVCAILVVLAGVGGVIYMQYLENAKKDIAKTQLQILTGAVEVYKLHNGDFPPNLAALAETPPD